MSDKDKKDDLHEAKMLKAKYDLREATTFKKYLKLSPEGQDRRRAEQKGPRVRSTVGRVLSGR